MDKIQCSRCGKMAGQILTENKKTVIKLLTPMGFVWYIDYSKNASFYCTNKNCELFAKPQKILLDIPK